MASCPIECASLTVALLLRVCGACSGTDSWNRVCGLAWRPAPCRRPRGPAAPCHAVWNRLAGPRGQRTDRTDGACLSEGPRLDRNNFSSNLRDVPWKSPRRRPTRHTQIQACVRSVDCPAGLDCVASSKIRIPAGGFVTPFPPASPSHLPGTPACASIRAAACGRVVAVGLSDLTDPDVSKRRSPG